jgi:hypothetical protein
MQLLMQLHGSQKWEDRKYARDVAWKCLRFRRYTEGALRETLQRFLIDRGDIFPVLRDIVDRHFLLSDEHILTEIGEDKVMSFYKEWLRGNVFLKPSDLLLLKRYFDLSGDKDFLSRKLCFFMRNMEGCRHEEIHRRFESLVSVFGLRLAFQAVEDAQTDLEKSLRKAEIRLATNTNPLFRLPQYEVSLAHTMLKSLKPYDRKSRRWVVLTWRRGYKEATGESVLHEYLAALRAPLAQ